MSNFKKICAMLLAIGLMMAFLTACNKEDKGGSEPVDTSAAKDSTTAILVVSFGTSYNDSRDKTIGAVENAIAKAYPQYDVRRAFTSQIIIDKLKSRDNLSIDNVTEALDRAVADGIKTLIVQPTHLMDGFEYNDLKEELGKYESQFDSIKLGAPLLTSDADFEAVATAITEATKSYDDGKTAIAFMGHGTEADSNGVYEKLNGLLQEKGYKNYTIGTVEAEPSIEDVLAFAKAGNYEKVVLEPLMVVAGDHANNDMAGDEDDSWKSILEGEGFQVTTIIRGLGELEAIQQIYVQHVADALNA